MGDWSPENGWKPKRVGQVFWEGERNGSRIQRFLFKSAIHSGIRHHRGDLQIKTQREGHLTFRARLMGARVSQATSKCQTTLEPSRSSRSLACPEGGETEAHKFARTHARTHGYTPQKCWLYLHQTLVSSANRALGSIWFNSLCHVFYRVCFKNSCVRWKHLVRNWKTNTSINCPPASMTAPIGKAY